MSLQQKSLYDFGSYRLDARERVLFLDGKVVPLAPKALDLLVALVEGRGHVISKAELMKLVWPDSFVEEANLSHHIFVLRKTLGEDENGNSYIETMPRRGYRFVAEAIALGDQDADLVVAEHTTAHIVIEEEQEVILAQSHSAIPQVARPEALVVKPAAIKPRLRTLAIIAASIVVIGGAIWVSFSRSGSNATLPRMTITPLTSFPDDEFGPALSPDGSLIAFAWTGGDGGHDINIYVKQVDAGTPLQLTHTSEGRNDGPAWSPDGRFIAFARSTSDESRNGLFVIPALGGPERKLNSVCVNRGLSWSPDGKLIAFLGKTSPDEAYSILLLSIDTLETVKLTSPSAKYYGDYAPAFSPDGQRLVFSRQSGDLTTADLFVVPTTGGEPMRLTFDNRKVNGAVWTPAGEEIIFTSNRAGGFSLWRIAATGGEPQRTEVGAENAYTPSMSRQGNRLAYTQVFSDKNIYKINLTASKARAISPIKLIASSRMDRSAEISRDGKRIVFESNRTGNYEIWVADSDGSNALQLTSFGGPVTGNPSLSPDGRQAAFVSHHEGSTDIYTVNLEGGPPRRLTSGAYDCVAPSWSSDGQWIYFGSNNGGSWQIWKMAHDGGEPVQITTNGGYEPIQSPDGRFLYYSKDGFNTVGLFRIPVEGGQEAMVLDLPQLYSFGDWAIADEGIYFIHRYDATSRLAAHPAIMFFNFESGKTSELFALDSDPGQHPGLSISPDRRWLIYAKSEFNSVDIMLVENFR